MNAFEIAGTYSLLLQDMWYALFSMTMDKVVIFAFRMVRRSRHILCGYYC